MLAPLMEKEGSGPSLRDPGHLNGPAITTKMAGANTSYAGNVVAKDVEIAFHIHS